MANQTKQIDCYTSGKLIAVAVPAKRAFDVYRRRTPDSNESTKPPSSETCSVSDLYKLIEADKNLAPIYVDPFWKYDN